VIVVGRVLAPHGIAGWIKARAFTASPGTLIGYRSWWLANKQGAWREFAVAEARHHGNTVLARLEGVSSREEAAAWRGASIGIPRQELPALASGEVYLADLVGLTVVNRKGEALGRVASVTEMGAHGLLRVERSGEQEHLIPLVPAYVDSIELEAGRILVDWQSDY
jgi:16S rRNA processing protein RimM